MSESVCTVAVDVGNTAVKLAVRRGGDQVIDHSIVIDQSRWQKSAIDWVRDQIGCRDTQWRIASVHRSAAEILVAAVRAAESDATIELVTYRDVPMPVQVASPEKLGIDRLLGAYAAHLQWGSPTVVVDAGSAVTIDWVDQDGCFCGGAIFPGLGLQAHALATGTDALPQLVWTPDHKLNLPAKSTADAIFGGILIGVAATIDRLTERYTESLDGDCEVPLVLTGGDSAALSPLLERRHHLIPNLVCRGLLNLSKS